MALLYGRAACLTAKNGGFRPRQMSQGIPFALSRATERVVFDPVRPGLGRIIIIAL